MEHIFVSVFSYIDDFNKNTVWTPFKDVNITFFLQYLPKTIKEGATKEDAEALKKAIEAVGGKVTLK